MNTQLQNLNNENISLTKELIELQAKLEETEIQLKESKAAHQKSLNIKEEITYCFMKSIDKLKAKNRKLKKKNGKLLTSFNIHEVSEDENDNHIEQIWNLLLKVKGLNDELQEYKKREANKN